MYQADKDGDGPVPRMHISPFLSQMEFGKILSLFN